MVFSSVHSPSTCVLLVYRVPLVYLQLVLGDTILVFWNCPGALLVSWTDVVLPSCLGRYPCVLYWGGIILAILELYPCVLDRCGIGLTVLEHV